MKQVFASKTFASWTFRSGAWTGVGAVAPEPPSTGTGEVGGGGDSVEINYEWQRFGPDALLSWETWQAKKKRLAALGELAERSYIPPSWLDLSIPLSELEGEIAKAKEERTQREAEQERRDTLARAILIKRLESEADAYLEERAAVLSELETDIYAELRARRVVRRMALRRKKKVRYHRMIEAQNRLIMTTPDDELVPALLALNHMFARTQ